MKPGSLSWRLASWIFLAFLATTLLTSFSKAQDTPPAEQGQAQPDQPQQDQPMQDQPMEDQPPQDARPRQQEQDSAPAQASAQKRDAQEEVQINDHTRTYVVHLPQGYDSQRHYPVVILLHGLDQDAAEMARLTHFNEFADRDSIIAVYPNAVAGRWIVGGGEPRPYRRGPYRRPGVWGPGYPPPGPRQGERREGAPRNQDMQFMHRMLERLDRHYSVDTTRIYAAGLGEGGFMAERMGCNMANRIAAIAVVAATMPRTLNCVPSRPLAALWMNGTDDPIVHYDGGRYKDGMLHLLSAEDSAKEWARLNHCSEKPSESKLPALQKGEKDTKVYLFDGCSENAQVALYAVKNGGHTWPGGEQFMNDKVVGKTSHALNANETIWSFLVTKKITGATSKEP
jgi:polyhydroxybutyrate depolymerase